MKNEMPAGSYPGNNDNNPRSDSLENRPKLVQPADIEKMNKIVRELDPEDVNIVLGEFKVLLETIIPNLEDKIYSESKSGSLDRTDGQKVVDKLLDELQAALNDFKSLQNNLLDGNIAAIKEYSRKRNEKTLRQANKARSAGENRMEKLAEESKKISESDFTKRLMEILKNQKPGLN